MRHHREVASTCIHGFAPGTCLICQTLEGGDKPTAKPAATAAAASNPPARPAGGRGVSRRPAAMTPTGPRVVPPEAPTLRSSFGLRAIGAIIGLVVVIVLAWTAFHLVFAVLHILELIGVALVAGYIGWVAGNFHGRRNPRS